jgi:IS5 family transposase
MKQADLGLSLTTKRTRKREFLDADGTCGAVGGTGGPGGAARARGPKGRPPFPVETMLRIHFMQQWFTLSDPAMEEALHDMRAVPRVRGPGLGQPTARREHHSAVPPAAGEAQAGRADPGHRQRTAEHKGLMLKTGTVVDATLIAAPSSTKNASGERDPEMHQPRRATSGTSA